MRGRFLLLAIALFGACSRAHSSDDDDDDSTSTSSSTSVSASSSTSADEHCFPCAREEAPCVCLYAKHIRPSQHAAYIQYAVDYYSLVFLEGTFNFGDNHSVSVTTNVRLASVRSEQPACISGGRVPVYVNASDRCVTIESIDFDGPRLCGIHVQDAREIHIERVRVKNVRVEVIGQQTLPLEYARGIAVGFLRGNSVSGDPTPIHSVRIEHCTLDLFERNAANVAQRRVPATPQTNVPAFGISVQDLANGGDIIIRSNDFVGANFISLCVRRVGSGNVLLGENTFTPDPHATTRYPALIEANLAIEIFVDQPCNVSIVRNSITLDAIQSATSLLSLSRGISAFGSFSNVQILENTFTFQRLAMQAVYIADSFSFDASAPDRRYNVIGSNRMRGTLMQYEPNTTSLNYPAAAPFVLTGGTRGAVFVDNDDSELVYPTQERRFYAFLNNSASSNIFIHPNGGTIGTTQQVSADTEIIGNFSLEMVE